MVVEVLAVLYSFVIPARLVVRPRDQADFDEGRERLAAGLHELDGICHRYGCETVTQLLQVVALQMAALPTLQSVEV